MRFLVITVCFNSAATICDTLASVAAQQGVEVEHIVVDGQAKTTMMVDRCREEHEQVVRARKLPGWQVRLLQARRFALMLAGGHFFYRR